MLRRPSPRIGHRRRAQHRPVAIDLEHHAVSDPRIPSVTLVVIAQRLTVMREVDPMAIVPTRPHLTNLEGRLADRVRHALEFGPVERVHLSSQRSTRERTQGLCRVVAVQTRRNATVGQLPPERVAAPILVREQPRVLLAAREIGPRVKPALRVHGRLVQLLFDHIELLERKQPITREVRERLGVPGLDHAEAPKLALLPVEVPVVIREVLDVALARDVVEVLDAIDDVHGKRQLGQPGPPGSLVGQVELRRRGVADPRLRAHVVLGRDQQVRLRAAGQINVAKHAPATGRVR
ncbi:hypothetical protein ENSA7_81530 [Enhygromyxa salina]|uniref:Uncharacterized protein n=1 Tax=Enhygromyxa salina TaxID=215803 RepID=A0A2S9XIV9_9BACT|nr:hypothetical protein ENSA7_81530 [Enhygromyxa salina]